MSDDLISRQAAIDAVGSMLCRKFGIGGDLAEITLKKVPSADVVEVVRCKDCKHKEGSVCDYSSVYVRPNGYCQWGEKKDE